MAGPLLIICSLFVSAMVGRAEDAGFVLELEGLWIRDTLPDKPLKVGESVAVGSRLVRQPGFAEGNPKAGKLVIVLSDGKIAERSTANGNLNEPLVLNPVGKASSVWARIANEVAQVFSHEKTRYVPTISRGGGIELREAVTLLRDAKLDLSDPFARLNTGKYLVRLRPAKHPQQVIAEKFEKLAFFWKDDQRTLIEVDDLPPGLYELSLFDDYREPTGAQAWILASAPPDFAKTSAAFEEARNLTKAWGAGTRPRTVRAFLRAYLDTLSAPHGR